MAFPSISTPITGGDFAAANGTTLESLNAAVVNYSGSGNFVCDGSGSGKISATYSEAGVHVSPASQLVEGWVKIVTKPNGNRANGIWFDVFVGAAPGSTSSDRDGYQFEIDTSTSTSDALFMYSVTNGTNTQIATSTATTFSNGDGFGWRVSGSATKTLDILRCVGDPLAGGTWNQTPVLTITDTTYGNTNFQSFAMGMTDSSGGPGRITSVVMGATVVGGGGSSGPLSSITIPTTAAMIRSGWW